MNNRKNIMTPRRDRAGGTYWVKIGTAWFNDKGGIQLVFDALPLPDSEGRVVANLFDPKPRDGAAPVRQHAAPQGNSYAPPPVDDLDDSIPFD